MDWLKELYEKNTELLLDYASKSVPVILLWGKALLILIAGWIVVKIVAKVIGLFIRKTGLDKRLSKVLGSDSKGMEKGVSTFVYLLGMLFVIMSFLSAINLGEKVITPLTNMFDKFTSMIPNLIGAVVMLAASIIIATIIKTLIVNLLSGLKVDERLGAVSSEVNEKLGIDGSSSDKRPITNSIGNVLYFLIILLMIPSVFELLKIDSIRTQIGSFTNQIWDYFPRILSSSVLLAFGIIVANIVKNILENALPTVGFDSLPEKLGIKSDITGGKSLSGIVAFLAMLTIIIIILAQSLEILDLELISGYAQNLVPGYIKLLGAVLISIIGILVANVIYNVLAPRNETWAKIAKYILLFFFGAIALQKAEISSISDGTFELLINNLIIAICVAVAIGGAIALGLGGRFAVERYLDKKVK